MKLIDEYVLTRDGDYVLRGSQHAIAQHIHRNHCYSVDWAVKYEGYRIVPAVEWAKGN